MPINFRRIKIEDKDELISMMKTFYSSDAVYTNGSEEIFNSNINACIQNSNYLEGYIIECDSNIIGYSMLAKSFSTEFGKPCIWFEDLYLKGEYRGMGIIPKFIEFIKNKYENHVFRLEVEDYNHHAIHVYEKRGFNKLPYQEMIIL